MTATLIIAFWIAAFLVFYSYIGYGIVAYMLVIIKRLFGKKQYVKEFFYPEVSLVVPAYNEISCIAQKIENSFKLSYPNNKLKLLFVTEGSTDGTTEFVTRFPAIQVIGGPVRRGKIEAINEAMQRVKTPIVVFTDANTLLNTEAIEKIVRHYVDSKVGAVAGEKRIITESSEGAAGSGEGIYWKYESFLKKLDSELYSVVGAAGELFSMRTVLYQPVEKDTLLDDFIISLRLAGRGYKVVYEPEAYAMEKPSYSVQEEMKRKIRICTGGFQSMVRLAYLLNPFKYGILTFQYVSHRVSRWAIAPFCLPVILVSSLLLLNYSLFYKLAFLGQVLFYLLACVGYTLEKKELRIKLLFIPFYFSFMNFTVYLGLLRYLKGNQSGIWEKAKRAA